MCASFSRRQIRVLRPRLPVLKLKVERSPMIASQTYHTMDIPLTSLPQNTAATSSANAVHRKQPVPVAASEDMTVITLEDIVPTLPNREVDTRAVTSAMRRKAWVQFAALCWSIFICGWNDDTTGPLIPRLQEVYRVSDSCYHHRGKLRPNWLYHRCRIVSFLSFLWLDVSYVTTSTALLKMHQDTDNRHNGSRAISLEHPFIFTSRNASDLEWYGKLPT